MLELVALGSDPDAARAAAAATGGRFYVNHPGENAQRPYSTLLRAVTDDLDILAAAADVALYVCFPREIKMESDDPSPKRVIASFAMIRHPDLSHSQSDGHWRDDHGPLALKSHSAMCGYTQLSFLTTLSGMPLDGIAMCAFDTRSDLSARFFDDDKAEQVIAEDVAKFADTRRSPRRVVLTEQVL